VAGGGCRRALSLLAASGLSRAAFACAFGLTATRLSWWERRLSVRVEAHTVTTGKELLDLLEKTTKEKGPIQNLVIFSQGEIPAQVTLVTVGVVGEI